MDTAALATEKSFSEHVRVTAIRATTPPPLPTGRGQRENNTRCGWILLHLQTEKSFSEHVRATQLAQRRLLHCPRAEGKEKKTQQVDGEVLLQLQQRKVSVSTFE
jgi:hypothetical protein